MDGTEAVRLDPNSALAYHSRGLAWRDMGNLHEAIADYTESIRLDAGDALAYFNRGEAWQKKGELDFAIDDFNQAIARDAAGRRLGSHFVGLYRNRGYAQFVKGDFGLSAANLSKVMGLGGNSYDVLYWYLASSRFGDDAVAELKDYAARLDTKKWPYPIIELFLGRLTASELIQKPRNLGERCEAQFSIGEWHLLNGNKSAARGNLQSAVEACPEDFTERAAARAELRQLSDNEPIPR
jgi:tetratricopeptide (TPR) repeat protein